jgi:hypothetical protein
MFSPVENQQEYAPGPVACQQEKASSFLYWFSGKALGSFRTCEAGEESAFLSG